MADILIRGMGMPKTCNECPLNVSIYTYDGGDETCALNAWDGYSEQPKTTRHPDCPLVPLPEGHGKIIDADAIWRNMPDDQAWVFQRGLASDLELFEILEAAEAIIPAEGGTEK